MNYLKNLNWDTHTQTHTHKRKKNGKAWWIDKCISCKLGERKKKMKNIKPLPSSPSLHFTSLLGEESSLFRDQVREINPYHSSSNGSYKYLMPNPIVI